MDLTIINKILLNLLNAYQEIGYKKKSTFEMTDAEILVNETLDKVTMMA